MFSYLHLRAMCSSQDPSITDERTTTETWTANYKGNLPWELTGDCILTIGDTMVWFIQGNIDFYGELCNVHKHISMQQTGKFNKNVSDWYV